MKFCKYIEHNGLQMKQFFFTDKYHFKHIKYKITQNFNAVKFFYT